MYATSKSSHTLNVHNIVLDGAVIVHLLKPIGVDTYEGAVLKMLNKAFFNMLHHKNLLELKSNWTSIWQSDFVCWREDS